MQAEGRNPGLGRDGPLSPDSAALHPGYGLTASYRPGTVRLWSALRSAVHVAADEAVVVGVAGRIHLHRHQIQLPVAHPPLC